MKTLNDVACILNWYSNSNEDKLVEKVVKPICECSFRIFFFKHTNLKRHLSMPHYLRMG